MTDPAITDLSKDAAAAAAASRCLSNRACGCCTVDRCDFCKAARCPRRGADLQRCRDVQGDGGTGDLAGAKIEELDDIGWLDLTIDGADELDPDLNLIKGGGGASARKDRRHRRLDRWWSLPISKVVEQLGQFHPAGRGDPLAGRRRGPSYAGAGPVGPTQRVRFCSACATKAVADLSGGTSLRFAGGAIPRRL